MITIILTKFTCRVRFWPEPRGGQSRFFFRTFLGTTNPPFRIASRPFRLHSARLIFPFSSLFLPFSSLPFHDTIRDRHMSCSVPNAAIPSLSFPSLAPSFVRASLTWCVVISTAFVTIGTRRSMLPPGTFLACFFPCSFSYELVS